MSFEDVAVFGAIGAFLYLVASGLWEHFVGEDSPDPDNDIDYWDEPFDDGDWDDPADADKE